MTYCMKLCYKKNPCNSDKRYISEDTNYSKIQCDRELKKTKNLYQRYLRVWKKKWSEKTRFLIFWKIIIRDAMISWSVAFFTKTHFTCWDNTLFRDMKFSTWIKFVSWWLESIKDRKRSNRCQELLWGTSLPFELVHLNSIKLSSLIRSRSLSSFEEIRTDEDTPWSIESKIFYENTF